MKKLLLVILLLSVLTGCTPAHEEVVVDTKSSGIVNADLTNDLAFLFGLDSGTLKTLFNADDFIPYQDDYFTDSKYVYKDSVWIQIGINYDMVSHIYIDYTKLPDRGDASLLGINGYDTLDTIVAKFGKENVYPYTDRRFGMTYDEKEMNKSMCSITLNVTTRLFFRADFDENGQMTTAFMGYEM